MYTAMPPGHYASSSARASAQYAFSFVVDAPQTRVFELVTPEGERRWAPGCAPRYLTVSKLAPRTVFETGGTHHPRIWVIDALDIRNGHIRYVALKPKKEVATIDVTATGASRKTSVRVSYDIVSLNADNDARVGDSVPDATALAEHWRQAFEAALHRPRS